VNWYLSGARRRLAAVAQAADLGVAETVEPAFLNGPAGLDPGPPRRIAARRQAHHFALTGRWGRTDNGVTISLKEADGCADRFAEARIRCRVRS